MREGMGHVAIESMVEPAGHQMQLYLEVCPADICFSYRTEVRAYISVA